MMLARPDMAPEPFAGLRAGHYAAIAADPPWDFKIRSPKGSGRSASAHYHTVPTARLSDLPVRDLAARDTWLFLWATTAMLPDALAIMGAWGFAYSGSAFCWVKTYPKAPTLFYDRRAFHMGMGFTTRKNVELVLLGRRGEPKRLSKSVRELIIAPRREHSRKPEEFYERVQQYCAGPYLDLFSRQSRPNWDAWGNEVGKFADYDAQKDLSGSLDVAYDAIKERQAKGGPGWLPK